MTEWQVRQYQRRLTVYTDCWGRDARVPGFVAKIKVCLRILLYCANFDKS